MALQQMTELTDCGLVGNRLAAEVNLSESSHRATVIESFLNCGISKIEPLLENVYPQHSF
jgi:hypothetical protein